ncbi:MAG: hypothetical protein AAB309_03380 [Deltaproteobacteria bacterium]
MFYLLLSLFFISCSAGAKEISESIVLEPLIVEAKKNRKINHIQVASGVGAKIIDTSQNELGVELSTLEKYTNMRSALRDEAFWIDSEVFSRPQKQWNGQVGIDISGDQKLKGRFFKSISDLFIRVDGRLHHDHRKFQYVDNHHTPYFLDDDEKKSFSNRSDTYVGSLRVDYKDFSSLIEEDLHSENVFAGSELTGFRKKARHELTARLIIDSFEFLPFSFFENRDFRSFVDKPYNNKSKDLRFGLVSRYRLPWHSIIQFEMSRDILTRNEEESKTQSFSRYEGKLTLDHRWETNHWFETSSLLTYGLTYDLTYDQSVMTDFAIRHYQSLNLGAEISSTKRYPFGIVIKGRKYAILPTPIQAFGDGALLQAAPALKPHSGIRYSAGPWYQSERASIEFLLFSEESENDFLMIATSPFSARTVGVGGVWNRGIDAKGSVSYGPLSWKGNYVFQIPLNASNINWQRGKKVPGRPRHHFDTDIQLFLKSYQLGCRYLFQSGEGIDLGENWKKGDEHGFGPYLGYQKENWGIRLFAKNLIAEDGNKNLEFQGRAGPNLLEPDIVKREWGVSMEVLL